MKQKRHLPLLIIITLLFFVSLLYLDVFRIYVVFPVYYVLRIVAGCIQKVPQAWFLYLTVLAGAGITYFGLLMLYAPVERSKKKMSKSAISSRYDFWLTRCRQINERAYSLRDLSYELRQLLLNVLACQEHRNISEMEQAISQGDFDVPPEVYALVTRECLGDITMLYTKKNVFVRLWMRAFPKKKISAGIIFDKELEIVISYLEERLEVLHD